MKVILLLSQKLAHIVLVKNDKVIFSESTSTLKATGLKGYGTKLPADKTFDSLAYSKPYELYEIGAAAAKKETVKTEKKAAAETVKKSAQPKKTVKKAK